MGPPTIERTCPPLGRAGLADRSLPQFPET